MYHSGTPTICRICKENCGIWVTRSKSGVQIKGNIHHPLSKGFVCFRGHHFSEVHNSPHRLSQPLLKRGDRHVAISHEDAIDIMAEKF